MWGGGSAHLRLHALLCKLQVVGGKSPTKWMGWLKSCQYFFVMHTKKNHHKIGSSKILGVLMMLAFSYMKETNLIENI